MKAIKVLAVIGTLALILAGAYGWVMGCCPGVPACGGCHEMNWERLGLIGIILVIVIGSMVIWLIRKIFIYPFGPPLGEEEDQCSTTNPERDYERRD